MSDSSIYINGDNGEDHFIRMMPYPSGRHESLISECTGQFWSYFHGQSCCKVFNSNTGLFIGHRWDQIKHLKSVQKAFRDKIKEGNERDISISPDLMILCNYFTDIFDFRGYHGIPKLVLEVWSPSTGINDVTWKKDIYEAIGIEEYWVITDVENVSIFVLIDGVYELTHYSLDKGKDILEIPSFVFGDLTVKIDKRDFPVLNQV